MWPSYKTNPAIQRRMLSIHSEPISTSKRIKLARLIRSTRFMRECSICSPIVRNFMQRREKYHSLNLVEYIRLENNRMSNVGMAFNIKCYNAVITCGYFRHFICVNGNRFPFYWSQTIYLCMFIAWHRNCGQTNQCSRCPALLLISFVEYGN